MLQKDRVVEVGRHPRGLVVPTQSARSTMRVVRLPHGRAATRTQVRVAMTTTIIRARLVMDVTIAISTKTGIIQTITLQALTTTVAVVDEVGEAAGRRTNAIAQQTSVIVPHEIDQVKSFVGEITVIRAAAGAIDRGRRR